jgi:hypothetical protein
VRASLLVAADPQQVLDHHTHPVTVVQQLPPRLVVIEADDAALAELRGHPDVLGIGDPDLPTALVAALTETERLFVDAWVVGGRPKSRRGDGLSWDAPGFSPPDPPPASERLRNGNT